jgi:hypothetical protein
MTVEMALLPPLNSPRTTCACSAAGPPAVEREAPLLSGDHLPSRFASLSPLRYPGWKRMMLPAIRQLIVDNVPRPELLVGPSVAVRVSPLVCWRLTWSSGYFSRTSTRWWPRSGRSRHRTRTRS